MSFEKERDKEKKSTDAYPTMSCQAESKIYIFPIAFYSAKKFSKTVKAQPTRKKKKRVNIVMVSSFS